MDEIQYLKQRLNDISNQRIAMGAGTRKKPVRRPVRRSGSKTTVRKRCPNGKHVKVKRTCHKVGRGYGGDFAGGDFDGGYAGEGSPEGNIKGLYTRIQNNIGNRKLSVAEKKKWRDSIANARANAKDKNPGIRLPKVPARLSAKLKATPKKKAAPARRAAPKKRLPHAVDPNRYSRRNLQERKDKCGYGYEGGDFDGGCDNCPMQQMGYGYEGGAVKRRTIACSPWIKFVKDWGTDNHMTYGKALAHNTRTGDISADYRALKESLGLDPNGPLSLL